MKLFVYTVLLSVILSISAVAVIFWIATSTPTEDNVVEPKIDGITKIELLTSDKKFYIYIHVDKVFTCEEIMPLMQIEQFNIEDRVYFPYCIIVNNELIKVTYTPGTPI